MKGVFLLAALALVALSSSIVSAHDPSPLQDFCVATNNPFNGVFVNGKFCMDPNKATANDFFFTGLNKPGNTNNPAGSNVTLAFADNLAGLNTLGISIARLDFAPNGGLIPPHYHPRATEVFTVLQGTIYVGFVTSTNKLISKTLYPGDVFVFPISLIHFQFNIGPVNGIAISGLSSQNPGVIAVPNAVFGANPPINPDVLAKGFMLDTNTVVDLQKKFSTGS